MKFSDIFDIFSRRSKEMEPFRYEVTVTFRNKIFLFCQDVFSNKRSDWAGDNHVTEFWDEIHKMLLYRHGRLQLSGNSIANSPAEDAINFLLGCKDEEFLDFVEYIFKVKCLFHIHTDENVLVAELNEFFLSDNLGYELSDMVKETVVEPVNEYPFFGREGKVIKTLSYPRVIRKDNQVVHSMAIKPALQLLSNPKYKTANQEFLEALEDYRRGDFGDCLTKSCSAFESVMKIICDGKGWSYNQTDSANKLVSNIIQNAGLDSFFESPLIAIATLRNKLSKSHGAGVQPKAISQNVARYSLNITASAIILLVNEIK